MEKRLPIFNLDNDVLDGCFRLDEQVSEGTITGLLKTAPTMIYGSKVIK